MRIANNDNGNKIKNANHTISEDEMGPNQFIAQLTQLAAYARGQQFGECEERLWLAVDDYFLYLERNNLLTDEKAALQKIINTCRKLSKKDLEDFVDYIEISEMPIESKQR